MQTNTTGSKGGADIRTTFDLSSVHAKAEQTRKPVNNFGPQIPERRTIEVARDHYLKHIQPDLEKSAMNLSLKNEGETLHIECNLGDELYDRIMGGIPRQGVA